MNIIYIGSFTEHTTEYYIKDALVRLGNNVITFNLNQRFSEFVEIVRAKPIDLVLFAKPSKINCIKAIVDECRRRDIKTVSWMFDLYFDLPKGFTRKPGDMLVGQDLLITTTPTTYWDDKIKHEVVRQGIYDKENFMIYPEYNKDIRFVGSMYGDYRPKLKEFLSDYDFEWVGQDGEYRGIELNKLLARTRIIVGDSVPYPKYWSNRVYEIIGRGGFLIMPEIDELKTEVPSIVTYKYGNFADLKSKLDYYLKHDEEREQIKRQCFEEIKKHTYLTRTKEALCKISKI